MEFLFIFLAIILIGYLVLNKTGAKLKETTQTKKEIIARYENDLKTLLSTIENPEDKKAQKSLFLKKCNDELSRNIFFTPEEAKEILQKLATL
jgi:predicted transcriptional regulator